LVPRLFFRCTERFQCGHHLRDRGICFALRPAARRTLESHGAELRAPRDPCDDDDEDDGAAAATVRLAPHGSGLLVGHLPHSLGPHRSSPRLRVPGALVLQGRGPGGRDAARRPSTPAARRCPSPFADPDQPVPRGGDSPFSRRVSHPPLPLPLGCLGPVAAAVGCSVDEAWEAAGIIHCNSFQLAQPRAETGSCSRTAIILGHLNTEGPLVPTMRVSPAPRTARSLLRRPVWPHGFRFRFGGDGGRMGSGPGLGPVGRTGRP